MLGLGHTAAALPRATLAPWRALGAWWQARTLRQRVALAAGALALALWWRCLPEPLFDVPYATAVEARDGRLLSARIAADGQWRFPPSAGLDPRYVTCVLAYEDEYFRWHPGVNPVSLWRAFRQNLAAGRVVSGGSTLTMQTIRLARAGAPRTLPEKLIEFAWATRLEWAYGKREILESYAAHAPFGGNVVGLEAAAWRYYGRAPTHFSWAEAAALAVLPNAPGVVYPGRSDAVFRAKRDRLLDKLVARGYLPADEAALAKLEALPGEPYALPDLAPQLALPGAPFGEDSSHDHVDARGATQRAGLAGARTREGRADGRARGAAGGAHGSRRRTTIDAVLQERLTGLVEGQRRRNAGNGVHNACALIASVTTGEVLAYVGNAAGAGGDHANRVDIVQAPRSSGSVLKPFLYGALLDAGRVSPRTLLPDIPTLIGGYAPQNFDLGFDGAVRADQALTRSLNVPHVRLLQEYGVARFLDELRALGLGHLDRPAEDYGLSLILGGGEVSPWELAGAYRTLAHTARAYRGLGRGYGRASWTRLRLTASDSADVARLPTRDLPYGLSAAAAWLTLEALTQLERPGDLAAWRSFAGSRRVAWKTGTSFGFRDAWAVGVTPEYVVVVWTGNADGEGRPGLTGAAVAAPLLFEAFDLLPATGWFDCPVEDTRGVAVCLASGLQAGRSCGPADTLLLPARAAGLALCEWHHPVVVDAAGLRVDSECAVLAEARDTVAFVLPPSWAHFYRVRHPTYAGMPPWAPDCVPGGERVMSLVYPRGGRHLYLPRDLAGERQAAVFEVAHPQHDARLSWYLDGAALGVTRHLHQWPLRPGPGAHVLIVVDERGRELRYGFTVGF